jgi:alkylation response protein AidB-like acyl-CoA dehydrogenase
LDLTLSPSEQAFRDELRAWLEANDPGEEPRGDDEAFEFRRDWQKQLNEGGWTGISWPKEYGGRGATLIEQAIFNEELARSGRPAAANVLALVMGGPVVITHGTDEQKQRFLEPILTGEEIWCQGFSEPESGSDLASLKTRAVKSNGEWLVTGQKVWTTFAHKAKWCMLVARTDFDAPKHKGLTYFIMDMEQEGVQVGGVGNGWQVALTTLMFERAGLGGGAAISIKIALGQLMDLARERGVDQDPIIRQKIADLYINAEALRHTASRGLTQIMKRGQPGPEGSLPKLQWSQTNQALTELAMDIRGDEGPVFDSDWTYRFLRARANSIEGGTTEILKNIIAERVLGLPRMR